MTLDQTIQEKINQLPTSSENNSRSIVRRLYEKCKERNGTSYFLNAKLEKLLGMSINDQIDYNPWFDEERGDIKNNEE